jgi:hypothetical protein
MLKHSLLFIASLLGLAAPGLADSIYNIAVNTSSISGTAGSLDLNFNPGPLVSQAASLQVLNFMSNGVPAGACPCSTGDVSGQLPGTLMFDNGTVFNDYFDGFTFGSSLSFQLRFYGPALNAPDGVSTSGSAFAFSMFSDTGGTIPALTTDTTDGFAFLVNLNLDGTTTLTNFSTQVDAGAASAVPEPATWALLLISTVAIIALSRRRDFRVAASGC